jgi:hypothetical protein
VNDFVLVQILLKPILDAKGDLQKVHTNFIDFTKYEGNRT